MKLRTTKNHYFEGKYYMVGAEYVTYITHGKSAVKNGYCIEIKMPQRKTKQHPKTKKGKLETK